jgi:hypothetical protein
MSLAQYNPHTLALCPGASAYAHFHEWAHVGQHARRTVLWRAFERLRFVPVLGRVSLLAIEIEAAWLAREEMRACGLWQAGDAREAWAGVRSYLRALTIV